MMDQFLLGFLRLILKKKKKISKSADLNRRLLIESAIETEISLNLLNLVFNLAQSLID